MRAEKVKRGGIRKNVSDEVAFEFGLKGWIREKSISRGGKMKR